VESFHNVRLPPTLRTQRKRRANITCRRVKINHWIHNLRHRRGIRLQRFLSGGLVLCRNGVGKTLRLFLKSLQVIPNKIWGASHAMRGQDGKRGQAFPTPFVHFRHKDSRSKLGNLEKAFIGEQSRKEHDRVSGISQFGFRA